ncbi:MAG: plastocyanin/azurin family copper-binding protein [Acidimicrobiales bacterium]
MATALFVPARIVYKQQQTSPVKPDAVVIANFAYSPETLTVAAGAKVTFTNTDGAAHTATADDKSFDSGRLAQGQSFELTVVNSITYYCTIHQYMTASIEVAG